MFVLLVQLEKVRIIDDNTQRYLLPCHAHKLYHITISIIPRRLLSLQVPTLTPHPRPLRTLNH
jgi:hypothetical protein